MGITFRVFGIPAPQGSKHGFVSKKTGKVAIVENSKTVGPWRQAVALAAGQARIDQNVACLDGPLIVEITFWLPRPKTAPKSRTRPTVAPDLDKLVRSTLDSLTDAAVFADDSQVCTLLVSKFYASPDPSEAPGALITVRKL